MPSDAMKNHHNRIPARTEGEPDETLEAVHRILAADRDAFGAVVVSALDEARSLLHTFRSAGNGRAGRTAKELGALAFGALDPVRFTTLLDPEERPTPAFVARFEEAVSALEAAVEVWRRDAEVHVEKGETLRGAVAAALAKRGRIYGVTRALSLLRENNLPESEYERLIHGISFGEWRSLERGLGPPMVVHVPGSALETAAGLAEFLDGKQKLVLLVESPCPPAPLAHLIAPGVLVLQTSEVAALGRVAAFSGPAVAALVPASAAQFLHDPEAGPGGEGGLEISHLPDAPPKRWIGGLSPAQQTSALRLLEARARSYGQGGVGPEQAGTASTRAAAGGTAQVPPNGAHETAIQASQGSADVLSPTPADDPAERLAAWLLSQADLGSAEA